MVQSEDNEWYLWWCPKIFSVIFAAVENFGNLFDYLRTSYSIPNLGFRKFGDMRFWGLIQRRFGNLFSDFLGTYSIWRLNFWGVLGFFFWWEVIFGELQIFPVCAGPWNNVCRREIPPHATRGSISLSISSHDKRGVVVCFSCVVDAGGAEGRHQNFLENVTC